MKNESRVSSLKKKRKIFGWLFLVSILVFFTSSMLFTLSPETTVSKTSPPADNGDRSEPSPPIPIQEQSAFVMPNTAVVVSVVSLLTSITSLLGFFSTTVLAWRKEKREALTAELEIKKKEIELEKLRAELDKSKEKQ